jgi:predicted dehydrogenase
MRYGIAYRHAHGYDKSARCEIVACADIAQQNADIFAERYPGTKTYLDYQEMLAQERLDIVSICTWPHLHAPMTIAAAPSGVRAIHCEKPMATTWGEAKRMAQACVDHGVQLTVDHQRRFGEVFRKAKSLLDEGVIGDLVRLEASCGNLYDWGTHWFDMLFMYNDDVPAKWVMGQIDCRQTSTVFGVELESQGLSQAMWTNGVRGLLFTGYESEIGCANRLIGTHGIIEVGVTRRPLLRMRGRGDSDWRTVETQETSLHGEEHFDRAIENLADCLESGEEPILSARKALQTTEVIFATYESSRRRARVDLPLDIEDSPLADMLAMQE